MIITLCGSARFEPWYVAWNEALTLAGHTVFGLTVYPSQKRGRKDWYTDAEKRALDNAHFRKIGVSDLIVVLNVFGYVGTSTMNEIEFARRLVVGAPRHRVLFLESWGEGVCTVSDNHSKLYKRLASHYDVPEGYCSPLDTTSQDVWSDSSLLGPPGPFRSKLVERTKLPEAFYKAVGRLANSKAPEDQEKTISDALFESGHVTLVPPPPRPMRKANDVCRARVWDNGDMTDCGEPAVHASRCAAHIEEEIRTRTEAIARTRIEIDEHEKRIAMLRECPRCGSRIDLSAPCCG